MAVMMLIKLVAKPGMEEQVSTLNYLDHGWGSTFA
jgi:hypothetical protein